jgi:hypothetical protein
MMFSRHSIQLHCRALVALNCALLWPIQQILRVERPREYFIEHWDTVKVLESYVTFFRKMGLEG